MRISAPFIPVGQDRISFVHVVPRLGSSGLTFMTSQDLAGRVMVGACGRDCSGRWG